MLQAQKEHLQEGDDDGDDEEDDADRGGKSEAILREFAIEEEVEDIRMFLLIRADHDEDDIKNLEGGDGAGDEEEEGHGANVGPGDMPDHFPGPGPVDGGGFVISAGDGAEGGEIKHDGEPERPPDADDNDGGEAEW